MSQRVRSFVVWTVAILLALFVAGLISAHVVLKSMIDAGAIELGVAPTIAEGFYLLLEAPMRMFEAGMARTEQWFAAIIMAGIAGVFVAIIEIDRSRATFESTMPAGLTVVAVLSCVILALTQGTWAVLRTTVLLDWPFPLSLGRIDEFQAWLPLAEVNAGIDVITIIGLALWLQVAWRVQAVRWMRTGALVVSGSSVAIVGVCAALSGSVIHHVQIRRPVVQIPGSMFMVDAETNPMMLVARDQSRTYLLDQDCVMHIVPGSAALTITDRSNLEQWLAASEMLHPETVDATEP